MRLSKKLAIAAVSTVAAVGVATSAFAYWTAGGSGVGSGGAGSTTAITAVQTTSLSAMYPGDSAQTLSGNFNNGNSGPVFVSSVVASISGVDKAAGAPTGTCDASDFSLTNATMSVGHEVAVGTGVDAWSGAQIHFNDKSATNQDACKGATLHLSYQVN